MKPLLLAGSFAAFLACAGAALADDVRVIVGFKGEPSEAVVSREGGRVHRALHRAVAASVPAAAVGRLRADAAVAYVEEDAVAEASDASSDAGANAKKPGGGTAPAPQATGWGVTKVGASAAWLLDYRGAGVKVAVIDTGIDLDHPDLAANTTDGADFVQDGTPADDDNGHGSHVAGIIAAVDNTVGYIGVAPSASLYAVKVLDRRGSGWLSDVAAGIDWAAANEMQVANMSLGASSSAATLKASCDAAQAAGVLLVVAAGNSGDSNTATTETSYPAAYASCVAIGATTSGDGLAWFSNTGAYLDLSAPGVDIPSAYKGGTYKVLSGTSMAAPHAAGMAALLLGAGETASTVFDELVARAVDRPPTGWDAGFGWGRVAW